MYNRRNKIYVIILLTLVLIFPIGDWNSYPASADYGTEISQKNSNISNDVVNKENLAVSPVITEEFNPKAVRLVVETEVGTDLNALAEKSGGKLVRTGPLKFATLEFVLQHDLSKEEILGKVLHMNGVLNAEWSETFKVDSVEEVQSENFEVAAKSTVTINDPEYSLQWGLRKVRANKVWEEGVTGEGVVVAVLDTGVDHDHPDFVDATASKNNIVQGYNAYTRSSLPGAAEDDHGHGTSVAGVIAALNNAKGIIGIAYNAKIMPIKVMNANGEGEDSIIADGIHWAVNHGAKIVNMSIGSQDQTKVLTDAIQYAANKGVLLVGASGNKKGYSDVSYSHNQYESNAGVAYPAADPHVLAVSAVDSGDVIADFSLTGPEVMISAPGRRIITDFSEDGEEGLAYSTGTSIAAPFVSASAALLLSKYPNLTPAEIKEALLKSAYDLGAEGVDEDYGYGRLDVYRALKTIQDQNSYPSPANLGWDGGRIYTGGTSEDPDGFLTIPVGAFPLTVDSQGNDRKMAVSLNKTPSPANFPNGIEPASDTFQLSWGEAVPEKILTFRVKLQKSTGENQISYLYKWSSTRWIRVGGGMGDSALDMQVTIYEPGIYRAGWSSEPEEDRVYGMDRIHTALEIAMQAFPTGTDNVIIARADDFPDALAGAPLAYKYQAPILLTYPNSLPDEVYQAVQDLAPKRIFILGGTGAVSQGVEDILSKITTVTRIQGVNRFETSAAVAEKLGTKGEAIVVNGYNYPDAIAAASHAAYQGKPILLTQKDYLEQSAKDALKNHSITATEVIGGTNMVIEQLLSSLPYPIRLSGLNRFATSASVIAVNKPEGRILFIATGYNFPDALTGGVISSKNSSNILLLPASGPTPEQIAVLRKMKDKKVMALGGEGAVSNELIEKVKASINS